MKNLPGMSAGSFSPNGVIYLNRYTVFMTLRVSEFLCIIYAI